MAIFQCDLRRKNYGTLWNNLFNFFHLNDEMLQCLMNEF